MNLPVFVIMAGGRGERFWPRSRRTYPKQLLALVSESSLLQDSVARIRELTEDNRIYIVTNQDYVVEVRQQLPMLPECNILIEPEGRNTAPCVGLAATYVASHFPDENPVMVILPSDTLVRQPEVMRQTLAHGIRYSWEYDAGVIFGLWPNRPETGYGYIQLGKELTTVDQFSFHEVAAFKEKPDLQTAQAYLASHQYLWNGGIFVWRVQKLLQEITTNLPELAAGLARFKPYIGTSNEMPRLKEIYPTLPATSVDYGILEKTKGIVVVPAAFEWDDLGSWNSMERYLPADSDGNVVQGDLIAVESEHCIVYSPHKTVVTLGVSELVIVETDDVLMVCSKDKAQEIKKVLNALRDAKREDLL